MILGDTELPVLVRVLVFHFMFAYVYPFYDGNRRTNRFISSYVLSRSFNPIVGYRLSYLVKEGIGKYYKGFSLCEHPLNRGDLTPFLISFSELIVDAMESMLDSLQEKQNDLADAVAAVNRAIATEEEDAGLWRVAFILAQATLFSENGATTEELCVAVKMSEPTMAKKRKRIKELGFLKEVRKGRHRFYSLDLGKTEHCVATGSQAGGGSRFGRLSLFSMRKTNVR